MISLQEIEWLKRASKDLPERQETVKCARPMTNEEVIERLTLEEGYPSRKHFQQVADIIKTIKDPAEKQRMAQHHADIFAAQNPRFNHAKWHSWIGTKNHHTEEIEIDEAKRRPKLTKKDIRKVDPNYGSSHKSEETQLSLPLKKTLKDRIKDKRQKDTDWKLHWSDYHAKRSGSTKKEETKIDETLPANAKAGDYVDDFVHSKNKMFSGDSKKQRIKRALGAYYSKKRGEETELSKAYELVLNNETKHNLDEVSWDKLGRYQKAAGKDIVRRHKTLKDIFGKYGPARLQKAVSSAPKLRSRTKYFKLAVRKQIHGMGVVPASEEIQFWKQTLRELYGKGSVEKIGNWHARMADKEWSKAKPVRRGSLVKKYVYHNDQASRADYLGMAISARAGRKYAEKSEKSNLAKAKAARADVKSMKEDAIEEKWGTDYETPKSKRGMFKGRSLSSLKSQAKHAHGTKAKQVDFAIRAKTGWGKV